MKTYLLLLSLLFSATAFAKEESERDIYQVTLRAQQSDMRIFICINDECQKALSHKQIQGEYFYNFGTFQIPNSKNIELNAWRHYPDKRRIRRTREQYAPGACNIISCGSFNFSKVNAPTAPTKGYCEIDIGVNLCSPRGGT